MGCFKRLLVHLMSDLPIGIDPESIAKKCVEMICAKTDWWGVIYFLPGVGFQEKKIHGNVKAIFKTQLVKNTFSLQLIFLGSGGNL